MARSSKFAAAFTFFGLVEFVVGLRLGGLAGFLAMLLGSLMIATAVLAGLKAIEEISHA